MVKRIIPLILAGGLAASVHAQSAKDESAFATRREIIELRLSEEKVASLSPASKESYDRAQYLADRVDFGGAIDALGESASSSPESVDLQFLLVKAARWRAETTYGEESVKYYDLAESAIRRLLANPALGPVDRTRVRRESERVTTGQENLRARDQARGDTGFKLVTLIRQERALRSGLMDDQGNPFAIDALLKEEEAAEETKKTTAAQIWSMMGAPGYEPPRPAVPAAGAPGQLGGGGFSDPFLTGGGGGFAGTDPFAAPTGDPFGAPAGGADPFAAPAGDPFGGGGAAAGDPFGGGGK